MRLRNIPRADRILSEHQKVIKNEAEKKGKWSMVFENEHPVYVDRDGERTVFNNISGKESG